MSFISICFYLLLCLSISMHACHARHFRLFNQEYHFPTKFHPPYYKVEEKIKEKKDLVLEGTVRGGGDEEAKVDSKQTHTQSSSSDHVPNKPLVLVSWRVPRKNPGDDDDEHPPPPPPVTFHSDYSQPRTRTPFHN